MRGTLLWLFLAACVTLLGLWVSAFLVARAQKQNDRKRARLALISGSRDTRRDQRVTIYVSSFKAQRRSPMELCGAFVGLDPVHMAQYPIPWWLVMVIALALSKGVQAVSDGFIGALSWATMPIAWLMISRYVFGWMEKRRKMKAVVQLPDLLDQVVRAVRVGLPVLEALRTATRDSPEPTRSEFIRLIDRVSVGTSLEDAVAEMARRCALPEYSFLATALALQNQTGGALSETLGGLAEVVRKRIAIIEKGKALSSEAKATAIVLTVLPFATGFIMFIMNPAYMMLLFTEPSGHKMLGMAAVSLFLGLLTIRTMFQKALSLT